MKCHRNENPFQTTTTIRDFIKSQYSLRSFKENEMLIFRPPKNPIEIVQRVEISWTRARALLGAKKKYLELLLRSAPTYYIRVKSILLNKIPLCQQSCSRATFPPEWKLSNLCSAYFTKQTHIVVRRLTITNVKLSRSDHKWIIPRSHF